MKKMRNFIKALQNLKEIEQRNPPYDTIAMTGMVALFSICFEQAWKTMKEQLESSGYSDARTGSPRSVIKLAYQAGMIHEEEAWLMALQARNNVAHSYNERIAMGIIQETKGIYIPLFEALQKALQSDWALYGEEPKA